MNAPSVGVERRIGQRFPFNVPVSLRDVSTATEGLGFTQDLSSRGAFLFTDMALNEGAEIELTLNMPSEITLGESMRIRCRARVLRIVKRVDKNWTSAASTDDTRPDERSSDAPAALETASLETQAPETQESGTPSAETRSAETRSAETKIGVAVCLSGYEYLPDIEEGSPDYRRISALHSADDAERPSAPASDGPRVAAH
jgi:hypothetical protein